VRTKIVCTIGPSTLDEISLKLLSEAGMDVARLNGSHSDLKWHKEAIELIKKSLPNTPILLDVPGRKIRTIQLKVEPQFSAGEIIVVTTDLNHDGSSKVPVNYSDLHLDLSPGDIIMADDGTLKFEVDKIIGQDIHCIAKCSGQLKSKKGINVPFVKLNTPLITLRDREIIDFAVTNQLDFVGISFVESSTQIEAFKSIIPNSTPKVIAKVENQGGLDNLDDIISAADVIMIDRGDLSVETSIYDIALKQKQIIVQSRKKGVPVIVATEMLHSMIYNSYPSKSEISDITNAVLDGCSATMLSGETAIGNFPLEAVKTMRKVIEETELQSESQNSSTFINSMRNTPESISKAIPVLCESLPITKIVAITRSGYAARMIARFQLVQPILAVSDDKLVVKGLALIAGTSGIYSEIPFSKINTEHILQVIKMLFEKRYLVKEDKIIVTGLSYPTPGSRMNTVQIYDLDDLSSCYNW
jgi:pyruvate kinase